MCAKYDSYILCTYIFSNSYYIQGNTICHVQSLTTALNKEYTLLDMQPLQGGAT